jgi:hypothetical protein
MNQKLKPQSHSSPQKSDRMKCNHQEVRSALLVRFAQSLLNLPSSTRSLSLHFQLECNFLIPLTSSSVFDVSQSSGGDKRPRRLPVSALSPSALVDKMPAYCEKKRLISLPTPDTHETQLSNCSHTNRSAELTAKPIQKLLCLRCVLPIRHKLRHSHSPNANTNLARVQKMLPN